MDGNKKLGLGVTVLYSLLVVALAYRANVLFYSHNLHEIQSDSVHYMAKLGEVLRNSQVHGPLAALRDTVDYGQTGLTFFLASLLGPVLPVSMADAVLLNGIWLVCLAVSSYLLFWQTTRSALLSFAFAVPLLTAPQILGDVMNGLTDVDPNLLAHTIGGSALCWILLSDRFRRHGAAAVAGLFLGLLILGRVITFGLLVPALFPVALLGLFSGTREERRRTLSGLAIASAVMLAVGAWWLVPKLSLILGYPARYWGVSLIGQASVLSSAKFWTKFTLGFLILSPVMPVVLLWRCGSAVRESGFRASLRNVNWLYLWIAMVPLVTLIALRARYLPYGLFSLCCLHLLMVLPLRWEAQADALVRTFRFRWTALSLAVLGGAGSLGWMLFHHGAVYTSKETALAVVRAIMADATEHQKRWIRIKMASQDYSLRLKPVNLDNLFLFDTPLPVLSYRRGRGDIMASGANGADRPPVFIVCSLPHPFYRQVVRNLLDAATPEERATLVESALPEFLSGADYFVIQGPQAQATSEDPIYSLLSKRLLAEHGFRRLTPVLPVKPGEDVIVLARDSSDSPPPATFARVAGRTER